MALTGSQRTALATEINTDPKALGYSPGTKINKQIATIINTVGASNETVNPGTLPTWQVTAAIVDSEWTALTQAKKDLLAFYLNQGTVDTTSLNVRNGVGGVFAAGATKTALIALVNRSATRAEVLFGVNVVVLEEDVSAALNRTA